MLRATTTPTGPPGSSQPAAPQVAVADPGIPDLPPSQNNEVHVAVEAPFVFRGDEAPAPAAPPAPAQEIAGLAMTYALPPETLEVTVLPPPPPPRKPNGFFGKVKGFFSEIFR